MLAVLLAKMLLRRSLHAVLHSADHAPPAAWFHCYHWRRQAEVDCLPALT
jgi:hypothetical protein